MSVDEFKTRTESVIADLKRLEETSTLLEFTQGLTEIAPKLLEWSETYETFRNADDETKQLVADIGEEYEAQLKRSLAHQSELKLQSPGAAGGKRRRMTRRYCKKTPCRKMGFSQKASCRPWKNCYQ